MSKLVTVKATRSEITQGLVAHCPFGEPGERDGVE